MFCLTINSTVSRSLYSIRLLSSISFDDRKPLYIAYQTIQQIQRMCFSWHRLIKPVTEISFVKRIDEKKWFNQSLRRFDSWVLELNKSMKSITSTQAIINK